MSLNNCPCHVSEMWFLCKAMWVMFKGCCMNRLDPEVSSLWIGCLLSLEIHLGYIQPLLFNITQKGNFSFSCLLLVARRASTEKCSRARSNVHVSACTVRQPARQTLNPVLHPCPPSSLVKHVIDNFLPGSQQKVIGSYTGAGRSLTLTATASPEHLAISMSVLCLDIYHVA